MSRYRLRWSNNILVFYEYEKRLSTSNFNSFKARLIERLEFINYNYMLLDFKKLFRFICDNATKWKKHVDILTLSDKGLRTYIQGFQNFKQHQISIFDEKQKNNNDFLKVLKSNMNAKKDRFIDLVNCNLVGNCYMITLTYNNNNVHFLKDLTASHKKFKLFMKSLNWHLFKSDKMQVKYVCRWELQKENNRNALHYHIIIFDTHVKRFDLNLLRKIWDKGSVNVKHVYKKTSGLGKYLSKYLSQDFDDFVSNKKSYFSSKNLIRPYTEFVVEYDKNKNFIILENGEFIDLKKYAVEKIENYESFYNGKTKKITYNKQ